MFWKFSIVVLIVSGLMLAAYPHIQKYIYALEENEMAAEWDSKNGELEQREELDTYILASKQLAHQNTEFEQPLPTLQYDQSYVPNRGELIGRLSIDKIDLEIPLVEGDGLEELKAAGGHLADTVLPGAQGNAAIAAHRSYTYGRLFNRLDEVEAGDLVEVETEAGIAAFKVTDKFLVLPTDLSVLEQPEEGSQLTLITCHPMKEPTHRLIVKGELIER